jgi:hypothetical protein
MNALVVENSHWTPFGMAHDECMHDGEPMGLTSGCATGGGNLPAGHVTAGAPIPPSVDTVKSSIDTSAMGDATLTTE